MLGMSDPIPALAGVPSWIAWASVIPLASGIGAVMGNWLDVLQAPMPEGMGSDWTRLLGGLFGVVGLGFYIGVLVTG